MYGRNVRFPQVGDLTPAISPPIRTLLHNLQSRVPGLDEFAVSKCIPPPPPISQSAVDPGHLPTPIKTMATVAIGTLGKLAHTSMVFLFRAVLK